MFEADLYTRLAAVVTAYPGAAPLAFELPCATYSVVDTTPLNDLDGFTELAFLSVQISVFDKSYKTAKAVATTIRRHLEAWPEYTVSWTAEFDTFDNTYPDKSLTQVVMTFMIFADLSD